MYQVFEEIDQNCYQQLLSLPKKVKFTGGEPFLIPQVRRIVEGLIDRDVAGAVTLQLTTNGKQTTNKKKQLKMALNSVKYGQ